MCHQLSPARVGTLPERDPSDEFLRVARRGTSGECTQRPPRPQSGSYTVFRYSCTNETAVDPWPTAEATLRTTP